MIFFSQLEVVTLEDILDNLYVGFLSKLILSTDTVVTPVASKPEIHGAPIPNVLHKITLCTFLLLFCKIWHHKRPFSVSFVHIPEALGMML